MSNARIKCSQAEEGCQVYYYHDNSNLKEEGQIANEIVIANETATFRFKTVGAEFLPSEERTIEVFKVNKAKVKRINAPLATPPYNLSSAEVLIDLNKENKNFRNAGWLGYKNTDLVFEMEFSAQSLAGIGISVLENQPAWIFPPINIEIKLYDEVNNMVFQNQLSCGQVVENSVGDFNFFVVEAPSIRAIRAEVILKCLAVLPDWHPGKGNAPWLFIDEIFIL